MAGRIENIGLAGHVDQRPDGTFMVTVQISGLGREEDAHQIMAVLQPAVTQTVGDVLKARGNVITEYQPRKLN